MKAEPGACISSSVIIVLITCVRLDSYLIRTTNQLDTNNTGQPSIPIYRWVSYKDIYSGVRRFNLKNDYIVLLHIQKTGGTAFEKHLVHDLDLEIPCDCQQERRRCICKRGQASPATAKTTWLISRFSTGWLCGLHPDFTQLKGCLTGLKGLFMTTFLRNPLTRFVSEYRHTRRGATWKNSKVHCSVPQTSQCYENLTNWDDLSLDQFMECKTNMAINRQTRMLADMNLVRCSDSYHSQDEALLSSAIANLKELAYFGLCEKQKLSQSLFERTFNLTFKETFRQSDENKTEDLISKLPPATIDRVLSLNSLDVRLYKFGKELFNDRLMLMSVKDPL